MSQRTYENFKFYFPLLESQVVSYRDISDYEIEVTLGDGYILMYNELNNSIRRLPRNCDRMTEDECRREFGMRLRSIMTRKHINQLQLSDMTGIPQASISNYMNGKSSPSFYNVDRIAKALGCSVDEFRYTR